MLDQSSIFTIYKFATFQYKGFEVQYESWDTIYKLKKFMKDLKVYNRLVQSF